MLTRLFIQNIVLIDQADISFDQGLCVLTGETGAGKSILLDALGLPLGARAESRLVRQGTDQACVSVEFELEEKSPVYAILAELGLAQEPTLILRRVLSADGKNRCFVNDQPVSVSALKQIGDALLEIHGQHDQRGLLNPSTHLDVLDAYGVHDSLLKQTETSYHAWKATVDALSQFQAEIAKLREEQEYLKHMHHELKQLAPKVGEEEVLAQSRAHMMQFEKLHETIRDVLTELQPSKSVITMIANAERTLSRSTLNQDNRFDSIIENLQRAQQEVADGIDKLEAIERDSTFHPAKLEQIEERLFALRAAARKYQVTADELADKFQDIEIKLVGLDAGEAREQELKKQVETTKEQFLEAALKLRAAREKTINKLVKAVVQELAPLKMASTQFEVQLKPLADSDWNARGVDSAAFEVATNKGMPFGALNKIASGGELSRFMLALKVVLAGVKSTPCIIFDEIDTGTGGAVADAIGQRLSALGKNHQIFVVTHLPQVAACGAHHYKVTKEEIKGSTFTTIEKLTAKAREEEIARMLAGAVITDEARKAAVKLIKAAV